MNDKGGNLTNNKAPQIDFEIAKGLAFETLLKRHPRNTLPDWFDKFTKIYWSKNQCGNFIVGVCVAPHASVESVPIFECIVNHESGAVTINVENSFSKYSEEDLQSFH